MNKFPKAILYISLILLFSIIISLFFGVKKGNLLNQKALENDLQSVDTLSSEDSALFNEDVIKQIQVNTVWRSKVRHPVSFTVYDSNYYLIFHKIEVEQQLSFKKSLVVNLKNLQRSNNTSYRISNFDRFKFNWTGKNFDDINNIYLNLYGDSLHFVKRDDTTISLYFLCSNFSISYSENGPLDICLEGKTSFIKNREFPIDILLLKRDNSVYFFFMTPVYPNKNIESQLLNRIIKGA